MYLTCLSAALAWVAWKDSEAADLRGVDLVDMGPGLLGVVDWDPASEPEHNHRQMS